MEIQAGQLKSGAYCASSKGSQVMAGSCDSASDNWTAYSVTSYDPTVIAAAKDAAKLLAATTKRMEAMSQ